MDCTLLFGGVVTWPLLHSIFIKTPRKGVVVSFYSCIPSFYGRCSGYGNTWWPTQFTVRHDATLVLYYSIEEFLEMLGVVVFIKGLLLHILDSKASGKLKFKVVQDTKTVMHPIREEV